jgi:hypothetical protein
MLPQKCLLWYGRPFQAEELLFALVVTINMAQDLEAKLYKFNVPVTFKRLETITIERV